MNQVKAKRNQTHQHVVNRTLSHLIVACLAFNLGQIRTGVGQECEPCESCHQGGLFAVTAPSTPQNETTRASAFTRQTMMELKHRKHDDATSDRAPTLTRDGNRQQYDILPGFFANNTLYLQGIRFTPSYDPSVDDLHVDLFGFPGDLTRLSKKVSKGQVCQNVTDNLDKTLWGRDEVKEHLTLFCQLDVPPSNIHGSQQRPQSRLIKMLFVPMSSRDRNQDLCSSFLWRCNVTEVWNKPQLLWHMQQFSITEDTKIPVHIWVKDRRRDHNEHARKMATFQIPVTSGGLGVGSAHIRGNAAVSYFHQPPISIGLCVAIYGRHPLKYLSQFVQHQVNIGFPSIFIGVRGPPDGVNLNDVHRILARYIDQGVVTLAHYDGPFVTEVDAAKLQFYLPCLYHYKGLAKYVATWDMDEFWIPPKELNVDGRLHHQYLQLDGVLDPQKDTTTGKNGVMINGSQWSTFPHTVTSDPLWQTSDYATSVSITDTVNAMDRYYQEHGCATSFCYHILPSHTVFIRRDFGENRTRRISQDFEYRHRAYDNNWQKSIVNTKYAHSIGFHIGGSCYFEPFVNTSLPLATIEKLFHPSSVNSNCTARRFEDTVFGSMHHFLELLIKRSADDVESNTTQLDEYVSIFAPTVEHQLERDDIFFRHWNSGG